MHSVILHSERESDTFPYTYLLEWEWPEHIELLLRRLIWARLVELTEETDESTVAESDHLAAKVCWLIAKSPETHPAVLDVLAKPVFGFWLLFAHSRNTESIEGFWSHGLTGEGSLRVGDDE